MKSDRHPVRHRPPAGPWLVVLLAVVACAGSGCYTKRMARMEGNIDTLRLAVEELSVHQAAAIESLQRTLEEQQELMHSMRAGTNLASQDLIERMEILSAKLDDTAERIWRMGGTPRPMPSGLADTTGGAMGANFPADPQALYEQAAKDFTQGRFEMALAGFRQLVATSPGHNYADNALYGVGECFYALAQYDSAQAAYQSVPRDYPRGDKVPAALYKLAMTQEKLGRRSQAKDTFERLRRDFPRSGEAILAEERLKELERL